MPHTPEEKSRVLARVRRIKGQLTALESALENEVACYNVLQQIAAIRGAIAGLMGEVLEAHIRETFGPAPTSEDPETRRTAVDEVNKLIRSYLK
jgi:DNA-binding FrmR family transcriptional regulator